MASPAWPMVITGLPTSPSPVSSSVGVSQPMPEVYRLAQRLDQFSNHTAIALPLVSMAICGFCLLLTLTLPEIEMAGLHCPWAYELPFEKNSSRTAEKKDRANQKLWIFIRPPVVGNHIGIPRGDIPPRVIIFIYCGLPGAWDAPLPDFGSATCADPECDTPPEARPWPRADR